MTFKKLDSGLKTAGMTKRLHSLITAVSRLNTFGNKLKPESKCMQVRQEYVTIVMAMKY